MDDSDVQQLRQAAEVIRAAGGCDGVAGDLTYLDGALPGSTTGHAAYDLVLGLGLWCSDLADFVEAVAAGGEHR
ncbi:hypothetical protein [Dermatophilus congolensis]|uniref:hypothetical protein n=1 Tax=Dermatophilus congolensis TaxID=1863 RepID=UPI001AAF45D5|nr:hypothetical protein [Dermatophilus congolensis]MBO3142186.1 hypothetical protein [Dermatophilus congolensis]MBO3151178.1 hypothetical protein [Dermatophilus congolensis]MBO3161821.1 hypothetical protein [Dermatophilus congolensis]MBO3162461.1 hypothetical protein [Dermatophilus congolensis]MBO3176018.1 hypothetical protein [Dermatophilus congolensis]